jgi:hypothetical protein
MNFPLQPVGVLSPAEGAFLQLPRLVGVEPSPLSRGDALAYARSQLLYRAGCRLAAAESSAEIARMFARPGVSVASARHRWSRLADGGDYLRSASRKNGIVAACKRDIAGQNACADALIDDLAPVWQLAASEHWSLAELEELRSSLGCFGVPIPPLLFSDEGATGLGEWPLIVDIVLGHPGGAMEWAAVNVIFYCLHLALATGNELTYVLLYYLMLGAVQRAASNGGDQTGLSGNGRVAGGQSDASVEIGPTSLASLDRSLLTDFWRVLGGFLQDWFSRIRTSGDIGHLTRLVRLLGLLDWPATWQKIELGGESLPFTGLYAALKSTDGMAPLHFTISLCDEPDTAPDRRCLTCLYACLPLILALPNELRSTWTYI